MEKPEYKSQYGDSCECPYCGFVQDIYITLDSDCFDEEVDCEDCGGKFRYDLEITVEYSCHPIDGEGPTDENGEVIEPKFVDPNQMSLLS